MAKKKSGAAKGQAVMGLLVLGLLVAALGFIWSKATRIHVIEVTGVSQEDAELITERSGITSEMHVSDIDATDLGYRLGAFGKWEYLGMETDGYAKVILHMRTRTARAVVHYAGSFLVLDEYAQVMENRRDDPEYRWLEILGLQIQSATVGKELGTVDKNQVLSVSSVIMALDETGAYSKVKELNASDLDNLYVITVSGIRVNLGDSTDMVNKCNWMIGVLDSLESEGRSGGTIDVSTGTSAIYKPG